MDWKEQLALVYSTDGTLRESIENPAPEKKETLPPSAQHLRIALDKRNRRGKQVTVVADFKGDSDDLDELCRMLKHRLGVGGSSKDGEILIQGDFRNQICSILIELGYKARVI